MVERGDEAPGELGVAQQGTRVEGLDRHEQRPREALGLLLVVAGAARLAGVDRTARRSGWSGWRTSMFEAK